VYGAICIARSKAQLLADKDVMIDYAPRDASNGEGLNEPTKNIVPTVEAEEKSANWASSG